MSPPRYQTLTTRDIPVIALPGDAGSIRVIAGEFAGNRGPAQTFTPVNVLEVRLRAGHGARLSLRDGYTACCYLLKGKVLFNGTEAASETELAIFDRTGDEMDIEATADATVFVMNGQPIEEPVVGHGPFVMNTRRKSIRLLSTIITAGSERSRMTTVSAMEIK